MAISYEKCQGRALPFGSSITGGGVNFSLFSRHGEDVSLLVYESEDDETPSHEYILDETYNRTGDIWHIELKGAGPGLLYHWRVCGPESPEEGHRFNTKARLLDPYAKSLVGRHRWQQGNGADSVATNVIDLPKCVVVDDGFDWGNDRHPATPLVDSVIYETHVRGFTRHESSGVSSPGTFEGLIEKIDYLKKLGVTAVELLPVHSFNPDELIRENPETGERLKNYWGYSTVGFFAPHSGYAAPTSDPSYPVLQFKKLVRELHREGLEVILDVVFNHTAEGNEIGPTLNFRGIDNSIYYILEDDKRLYRNYSGCGNTVNCNHPIAREFIRQCLRYWVLEMRVDGFRFDLASILGRDQDGSILANPPLIQSIAEDPILRHVKLIAEAWDAAGAYQVGSFPGFRWSEWNGRYRDDVRRFWAAGSYSRNALATRITGSSDLYEQAGRNPVHSINFITCHDGFTLNDLVSYNDKHNLANGEDNRDGDNHNLSWNSGAEGSTTDPAIEALRTRRIKNFIATLLLSQGVPMLLAGDELRRTQNGNNNAYCQDNELNWIDWGLLEQNADMVEFTSRLIAFRKRHPAFRRECFLTGRDIDGDSIADAEWYENSGKPLKWGSNRPVLALFLSGNHLERGEREVDDDDFYLMFNSGRGAKSFRLPELHNGRKWSRVLDTNITDRVSIVEDEYAAKNGGLSDKYTVAGQSVVLLISPTGSI